MNKMLKSVEKMHVKFGMNTSGKLEKNEKKFRIACMLEEIEEYKNAKSQEEKLDALVDLIVFAMGTVVCHNFQNVFEKAFDLVMQSNMKKQLGENSKRNNFKKDLIKPHGWKKADLSKLF